MWARCNRFVLAKWEFLNLSSENNRPITGVSEIRSAWCPLGPTTSATGLRLGRELQDLPGLFIGGCKIIHSQGVRATAVIMQWNTIPAQLQRELFDTAGSMGELLRTSELRGQIARFLHHHKDDGIRDGNSSTVAPST
jgi:hypothetical protein